MEGMASTYHVRHLNSRLLALGFTGPALSARQFSAGPNFPVVANILQWLAILCGSSTELDTWTVATEEGRVAFLQHAADHVARHANVSLDLVAMYEADDRAVPELINLCNALLTALRDRTIGVPVQPCDSDPPTTPRKGTSTSTALALMPQTTHASFGGPVALCDGAGKVDRLVLATKLQELKSARATVFHLVDTGASLLQALERHNGLERVRLRRRVRELLQRLALNLDGQADHLQANIQRQLEEQVRKAREDLKCTQDACLDLDNELKRTNVALSRVTEDSDRAEQRLKSLQHLKPAFMDDRKRLLAELQETYEVYIACVRNESFLEMEAQKRQAKARDGLAAQQKFLESLQQKVKDKGEPFLDCESDRGASGDDNEDAQGQAEGESSVIGGTPDRGELTAIGTRGIVTEFDMPADVRRYRRSGRDETRESANGGLLGGHDASHALSRMEQDKVSLWCSSSDLSNEEACEEERETKRPQETQAGNQRAELRRRETLAATPTEAGKKASLDDFYALLSGGAEPGEASDAAEEELMSPKERRLAQQKAFREEIEDSLF
ncbi:hypothetical protein BESB_017200 [Besnoitia besnoiti]|uniref:Clusterin-associated protein 1 n=1 Tax=Besnoitia besnoiti TaxID=94643 RepID=A0A2A9MAJ0_BESBE|nr:hypothetical protein BESB_017200 [Besnoitia besnoiti]PFH32402.1 hypothetical protein BESB_017200 [Besnoitia besnoiti]